MSSYGTAQVEVRTWVAGQQVRDALMSCVPASLADQVPQVVGSVQLSDVVQNAVVAGVFSTTEAAQVRAHAGQVLRDVVATAAVESLRDLGFVVQAHDGAATAIWAERGHERMAVEVHDGGGFVSDIAGIEGYGCQDVMAAFVEQMEQRGVGARVQAHTHLDPRGGQLVRRVTRATGSDRRSGSSRSGATQARQ